MIEGRHKFASLSFREIVVRLRAAEWIVRREKEDRHEDDDDDFAANIFLWLSFVEPPKKVWDILVRNKWSTGQGNEKDFDEMCYVKPNAEKVENKRVWGIDYCYKEELFAFLQVVDEKLVNEILDKLGNTNKNRAALEAIETEPKTPVASSKKKPATASSKEKATEPKVKRRRPTNASKKDAATPAKSPKGGEAKKKAKKEKKGQGKKQQKSSADSEKEEEEGESDEESKHNVDGAILDSDEEDEEDERKEETAASTVIERTKALDNAIAINPSPDPDSDSSSSDKSSSDEEEDDDGDISDPEDCDKTSHLHISH
jgi:hypothetical protein